MSGRATDAAVLGGPADRPVEPRVRDAVEISVVVCTRNRGALAVETVRSVLANDHSAFEVLVVDQNPDLVTASAMRAFDDDPRFCLLRSATRGQSRARNVGLRAARGGIVAFTDDDCTVPPDWLSNVVRAFAAAPRAAMVFTNVVPGAHDPLAGFIPNNVRHDDRLALTLWEKTRIRGIGAGMSVRRSEALQVGGFDDLLGPGAEFPSCDDADLEIRLLLAGHGVYETAATAVVHNGFRSWREGRELARRDWGAMGADYGKLVKCRQWRALPVLIYDPLVVGIWHPLRSLLSGRSPRGLRNPWYFTQGFVKGLRQPVDRRGVLFRAS